MRCATRTYSPRPKNSRLDIDPTSGEDLQALIARLSLLPPAIIERARQSLVYKPPATVIMSKTRRALLLALHGLSASAGGFRREIRYRLGDGAEQLVGRAEKPRPLSAIYRPARLCRRARLRRHGAQRAPPEHLRADALAQPDRRGAVAADQARQDRHPRQSPAPAPEPAARRRRIRDARQHVGRPADRGLRAGLGAGDVQLRRALCLLARPILGGRRPDPPRLDRGRAVFV